MESTTMTEIHRLGLPSSVVEHLEAGRYSEAKKRLRIQWWMTIPMFLLPILGLSVSAVRSIQQVSLGLGEYFDSFWILPLFLAIYLGGGLGYRFARKRDSDSLVDHLEASSAGSGNVEPGQ